MSRPSIVWHRDRNMTWVGRSKTVSGDEWTVTEDGWHHVLWRNGEEVGTYASATKAKRAAERLVVVR